MNQFGILITGYSLLLLIGGVFGYFMAGSIPSLLMSTIFAILLIGSLFCRFYKTIFALLGVLVIFFAYRWYVGSFMPPGMLCIVTIAVAIVGYLMRRRVTIY